MRDVPHSGLSRAQKTRRLIIDNASKIFHERGFRNVTVEELCRIAGVSKRTFYKYFQNRDELVDTVLDECLAEALPAMDKNFKSDGDVVEIFEIHYNLIVDLFLSKVSARMMADMESQMPKTWERVESLRRTEMKNLIRLFRRGQREGAIRKDIDPKAATRIFEEIMARIFRPGFLISNDLTLNQAVSTIMTVFFNGILEREIAPVKKK
jgi:AcrR family transcriptional regulator